MKERKRALVVVPSVVMLLTGMFTGLSYLVLYVFSIPIHFNWSVEVRTLGAIPIVIGLFFAGWLFKYRNPSTFLVSTYETMRNTIRSKSGRQAMVRSEALILQGPHRHVRHPIYFAAVMQLLGLWLVLDFTLILLLAIFFFLWFTLVVIRFEELELRALFGKEYEEYARAVPKILPTLRPRWPTRSKME